jgi:uroporphyrin-III C-methyltransferase/precorrin-2 dehydrogenase/sirohydrochlorin ferrochelatase
VVSPVVTPAIEGLGDEITLVLRGYRSGDLDGAWYVIAATDDRQVNELVSAEAEASTPSACGRRRHARHGLDAGRGPARHRHVAVLDNFVGGRDPRRSAYVRDEILAGLRDGAIAAPRHRERTAGVVLIGGGPGDPELVTVAGRKALMEAEVVVADRLAPRELLGELPPDVELIDVAKLPRGRFTAQEEINRVIVQRALAGKRVARFKGGDSFVFGRGYEEVEACQAAGVPVTVVPGISSPLAVPAVAGIPVTHRGVAHDFTVVSGHLPPDHEDSLVDWNALGRLRGTVVLMMAVANAPVIADALVAAGRPAETPVGIVCDGTMPGERTVLGTLGSIRDDIATHDVRPPAIIVVGDVVAVAHPEHFGPLA